MKKRSVLLAVLAIGIVWEILALIIRKDILPTPDLVLKEFILAFPGNLGLHFLVSFLRVIISMAISILLAAPAGLILSQSKKLNDFFSPVIYLLYPVPKVVLVPIIILFFGINDFSKIITIVLVLFFQILVLVRDQGNAIPPQLISSVRSLGAGRRALFRYVYLPATLPAILTAIRQSIGTAVAVLYIVELVATQLGLGYYIYINGSTLYDYPKMYAGVLAMSLLGLGLYYATDILQKKFCLWQELK